MKRQRKIARQLRKQLDSQKRIGIKIIRKWKDGEKQQDNKENSTFRRK